MRRVGGWACFVVFAGCIATIVNYLVDFIRYKATGKVSQGWTQQDFQWGQFAGLEFFLVVGAFFSGAGALILLFDTLADTHATPPEYDVWATLAGRKTLSPLEEKRKRDAEMLRVAQSNPQLDAVAPVIERLLRGPPSRDGIEQTEHERSSQRREIETAAVADDRREHDLEVLRIAQSSPELVPRQATLGR
ncbi:hypothetical protein AB0E63_46130 [Kribbella sp. NPDC026596]|uniref:hypothetical protein n=1 Tax=Kribbella sp. NPDC026596 TaxID=3155122 RepID=UPI0033D3F400